MPGRPLLLVEALATRNDSGLGRLTRLMVDSLAGLAGDADIRVILPRSGTYTPGAHCRPLPVGARPFRLWTQAAFPLLIARLRPRVVLCLGQTLPRVRPPARYALMIPDAGPLEALPHRASSHDAYNRRWLRSMPPRADRILTIGEFSRDRLMALLGLPADRIAIVRPIDGPAASQIPSQVPTGGVPTGPYLLAMGNVEPRKNFPGLIAAYARLRARRPDVPPLHIVGHKAWGYAEAANAAREHGVEDAVIFTGFVPEEIRTAYLANCSAFLSSSLYEGWGLPLFEALALGKPALYHRGSSQEEFARGMALAVDCADPVALASAMEKVWSDAAERARLRAALAEGFGKVLDYDVAGALRAALLPLLA